MRWVGEAEQGVDVALAWDEMPGFCPLLSLQLPLGRATVAVAMSSSAQAVRVAVLQLDAHSGQSELEREIENVITNI